MPLVETWRRWGEWGQLSKLPSILDDFVAGGFLILGAVIAPIWLQHVVSLPG
jgi:hypothetical protein